MNRFGMFSWFGYPIPFEERLDLIKGAGFDATGFWLGPEEEIIAKGKIDLVPDLIRSKGLFLEYVHAPDIGCNDVWAESTTKRKRWMDVHRSYIDLCGRHSIPILVIHVSQSKGEQPGEPTEDGLIALRELVKVAEDTGTKIAVENTMQPALLELIFLHIQSDYLGFCYDTSHDFLYSLKPGELFERWGHRLMVTHIGDNDGVLDRHWLPGLGKLDWKKIAQWFSSKTHEGSLILEVFPKDQEQESPSDFMTSAYQSIQWLHNLLKGEGYE